MAQPKYRHSRARRDKSRSHFRVVPPTLSRCPKCREPKQSHCVCPSCGTYKGRVVLKKKAEAAS